MSDPAPPAMSPPPAPPAPTGQVTADRPAVPGHPARPAVEQLAWGLLAAAGVAALWCLVRFWGASTEYADRFLIVLGSGWLVWRGRDAFARLPARPTVAGLPPLAAGAALFPFAWYLAAQVGPRAILLWWLTAAWVL